MNVSADDALLILGKWQEERRIVQAGLYCSSQASSCIVGRIEVISPDGPVRITAGSLIKPTGGLIGLQINLRLTRTAAFHDWQGEPPQPYNPLQQMYDAFLYVNFGDYYCKLYTARPGEEPPTSE